jgi:hypothetical protein
VIVPGVSFAQDTGRVDWSARARTDIDMNFRSEGTTDSGTEEDIPGFAFGEDGNGGAYSWNTTGELLLWYGKGSVSMWGILTYRQGWGFETKYNLSYDSSRNGNIGGKVQTGSRFAVFDPSISNGFNLFELNRLSLYGWWQVWDKRLLLEMNPFGALEDEWDSVWKTPAYLFDDHDAGYKGSEAAFYDDNLDTFFRANFRNVIDNLSFGFGLPNFGQLNKLQWTYNRRNDAGEDGKFWDAQDVLLRANFGAKYTDFNWGAAAGFKLDPNKAQRAYIGGEYKALDQRLGIRMDMKMNNIGALGDKEGDLDIAGGVQFREGPFSFQVTLKGLDLFYDDNKDLKIAADNWVRYMIIGRKLLSELEFVCSKGVGGDVEKAWQAEFRPGLFWAIGNQGVTDSLDDYSGMFAQFRFKTGKDADDLDVEELGLRIGFRWSP